MMGCRPKRLPPKRVPALEISMMNLCEFLGRKTLGAPSPALVKLRRDLEPKTMGGLIAPPDPGSFAF